MLLSVITYAETSEKGFLSEDTDSDSDPQVANWRFRRHL